MLTLAIGDIVGKPGRRAVITHLPDLRRQYDLDLVIANGENAVGGIGLTPDTALELIDAGVCTQEDVEKTQAWVDQLILKAYKKAIDLDVSPHADLKKTACLLDQVMFSDLRLEKMEEGTAEVRIPMEENPRMKQLAKRRPSRGSPRRRQSSLDRRRNGR